jgi:hypothetical protein
MSFLAPSAPKIQPLPATPTLSQADIQAQEQQTATLAAQAQGGNNNILTNSSTQTPSNKIQYATLLGS